MKLHLAEIRESKRMTQQEIAKVAGVSPKTEWNWEQGKSFPNASQIWDMAVHLGCTPNDLCGWYDEHPRPEAPPGLPPEESELVRNWRACSPQWRHTVSMTARAAAGESREEAERAAYAGAVSEAV